MLQQSSQRQVTQQRRHHRQLSAQAWDSFAIPAAVPGGGILACEITSCIHAVIACGQGRKSNLKRGLRNDQRIVSTFFLFAAKRENRIGHLYL